MEKDEKVGAAFAEAAAAAEAAKESVEAEEGGKMGMPAVKPSWLMNLFTRDAE